VWLFTTFGFFSVTQMQSKPEVLQVRARVRGDLDLLRTKYLPELSETIELKGRDYPYRGYTDRACLSAAMVAAIHDLTYSNFKNEVERVQGLPREKLYARVWSVMYQAESKIVENPVKQRSLPLPPVTSLGRPARFTWEDWKNEDTGPGISAGEIAELNELPDLDFDDDMPELPYLDFDDDMPESLLGDPELETAVFNKPERRRNKKRQTRSR
jgi:hypothetical protein